MHYLVSFVLLLQAAPVTAPTAPTIGGGGVAEISKQLRKFVATKNGSQATLRQLVLAVKAIEDQNVYMTTKRRLRIAKAALAASRKTGVDAFLLIAVARVESDFRGLQVVSWKCKDRRFSRCTADCGITQHYISGPKKWVITYCRVLANNYTLSFSKSAKEIMYHIRWCNQHRKYNKPMRRCVLNRYNSGTFYRTAHRCNRRWSYCRRWCPKTSWVFAPGLNKEAKQHRYGIYTRAVSQCSRIKYKCLRRASYWKQVLCFDYGARTGHRSKRSCRRMGLCSSRSCRHRWGLDDIESIFYGRPTQTAAN